MPLERAFIPYGAYWSTPFCRWQGSLGRTHAIELAARTAARFLAARKTSAEEFDSLVLGTTVPQSRSFYGGPWLASMIGAPAITGPLVSQACATSVRALNTAALEVESGMSKCVLSVTCDRTSNGPHVYYPDPAGTGGMGGTEDPVWDNFNSDPNTGLAMIRTAENVAREAGISRKEQDDMTLLRHRQYQDSLAGDRAFQRRYMVAAEIPAGKKKVDLVEADEGVFPTTEEGLAKLRPVLEDGTVTYGTQTFPADGNAGIVVCSREKARAMAGDAGVPIRILSFGTARSEKGFMPKAVVPAARRALELAGIGIGACKGIKTHNPFAVNDVYFCRETGVDREKMNRYGSALIWGHPQGPTGTRSLIELIEELVAAGGGYGLFSGCAAGDTAMAVVIKVG
jgi:acetyl-CoA acetyltransferase family protein